MKVKIKRSKYISDNFTLNIKQAIKITGIHSDGFNVVYPIWYDYHTNITSGDFDDGDYSWDECSTIANALADWLHEEFYNVKNWNKINPKDYIGKDIVLISTEGWETQEDYDRYIDSDGEESPKNWLTNYYLNITWDEGRLMFSIYSQGEKKYENEEG